jgi:hypothetical protein
MFERTHIPEAPRWIVEAVDEKRARLNCIHHLLSRVPYDEVHRDPVILLAGVHNPGYRREELSDKIDVPEKISGTRAERKSREVQNLSGSKNKLA